MIAPVNPIQKKTGGLGGLIGKIGGGILGATAGAFLGGPKGALTGYSFGSNVGGTIGGAVDPEGMKQSSALQTSQNSSEYGNLSKLVDASKAANSIAGPERESVTQHLNTAIRAENERLRALGVIK